MSDIDSTNNNQTTKFNYIYAFISNKLNVICGPLHTNDIKELLNDLKNFVSYYPLNSNHKVSTVSNFGILDMSLSDFKNKKLGESKIMYDDVLQHQFSIDIESNN